MPAITTRRTLLRAAGAAAAIAPLAAPAIARAQSTRVFSLGHDEPHDTGYGFFSDQFNAKLKELSGGRYSIHEFYGAQLGQEPEMAQKVPHRGHRLRHQRHRQCGDHRAAVRCVLPALRLP